MGKLNHNKNIDKKVEAQILHSQKLESLGLLAGGIAHDFNNILMAILGYADLALVDIAARDPLATQHVKEIEKSARRAADLCRQMLVYSGRGDFVVIQLQLADLIQNMDQILEVAISKKAVLRYEIEPALPKIMADTSQLQQIIMNLITNASQALESSPGIIHVRAQRQNCSSQILSEMILGEGLLPGEFVCLEVEDDGIGMNDETLAGLFEPSFTARFSGRGLGLMAVASIVKDHGGALTINSRPGEGTRVRVYLPACPGECAKIGHTETALNDWCGRGTVLLVDDESSIRAVARQMLERLGFTVELAVDGAEGLEIFAQTPDRFVCVLLDLAMPQMDGETCFGEMRKIRADVPVVFSSGVDDQVLWNKLVADSRAAFIMKPYSMAGLSKVLQGLLSV